MISRSEKANILIANYDKLVALIGVVALVLGGAFFAMSLGEQSNEALDDADGVLRKAGKVPEKTGVEEVAMDPYAAQLRQTRTPSQVAEVAAAQESFLASEKRVKCACGKVMPAGLETCPACNVSLVVVNKVDEDAKKADLWAKKFGVTMDDEDADGDGFTNAEEYAMGTDPTDSKSHADYLESLAIKLPLKPTYVPFYLKAVNQIPSGYRCEFVQGKNGAFTATVGEELVITKTSGVGKTKKVETGYKLVSAEKAEKKVKMVGVSGTKTVDASFVNIERISDGKKLKLVVQNAKPKLVPVDVQATLIYTRGEARELEVVSGAEIDLSGTKYKVVSIKAVGKGAEVELENILSGKKQTLKALE